ncbi:N-acetylmuramidase family protein [Pseudomonas tolaasii]|uniref:N-acetylmuramidase family protein n=1 Tax=Pseudomonas tolaasii TaxID=29442 RepID=UPI0002E23DD4|nr:N-acetylmuramidase family protein [Pseudomonas tolaasii]
MPSPQDLPLSIKTSVGTPGKAVNEPADVRNIQRLFNLIKSTSELPLVEDGKSGPKLMQRITDYQVSRLKATKPDGIIDPAGRTFNTLLDEARKAAQAPGSDKQHLVTKATCDGNVTLTDADFQNAAAQLGNGIAVNIIKAFAIVESGGRSGFGPALMPVVAYEGHIFRKYTQQKYDKAYPFLSYPYLEKAGPQWRANNKDQATAWKTMLAAFNLDPEAALMSASYGMFQIMGFNFAACGYKNVFDFVAALKLNAGQQLKAFVGFCSKNPALIKAMKTKDYVGMARNYNGKDFGDYDKRIQKTYEALEKKK